MRQYVVNIAGTVLDNHSNGHGFYERRMTNIPNKKR